MTTLPTEIWLLILEQLCPHCHCDDIPDFRLVEHSQGISALWALSLTCRSINELCRQYLYHCFYSTPTQDRASKFLRTLISQPQLGRLVRILSLPLKKYEHEIQVMEDEVMKHQDANTWIKLSEELGVNIPPVIAWAVSRSGTLDQDMKLGAMATCAAREWLNDLILRCCPGVSRLELDCIPGPKEPREEPPGLRNLQMLACRSLLVCQDLPWFLEDAPFMRRLITNRISYNDWHTRDTTSVTNIRKISMVISARALPHILAHCPQLEDIEIHLEASRNLREVVQVDHWPSSIKRQLRRLAWSSSATMFPGSEHERSIILPPITDFENLEILEIDRSSLYLAVKRKFDSNMSEEEIGSQLPTILPASLRMLHTSFNVTQARLDALVKELRALALAKKTFLRNLSLVQVDHPPATEPGEETIGEILGNLGVAEIVADAGVQLKFDLDPPSPRSDSMGILSIRPGTMEPLCGFKPVDHVF